MNKPWVTTVSLLLAIGGIAFAVITYITNKKVSEISFAVELPSYTIYDSESVDGDGGFRIIDKDSSEIDENIYLTTISIWNSGDLTIRKENCRPDTLLIKIQGLEKRLGFEPIKKIKEGISDIKLIPKSDSIYRIDWKFFDPKDGIKYQLVYTGEEDLSIEFLGSIIETEIVDYNEIFKKRENRPNSSTLILLAYLLSMTIIGGTMKLIKKVRGEEFIKKNSSVFLILILVVLSSSIIFYMLSLKDSSHIPF